MLFVESIGIRITLLHFVPLVEVLMTMSFDEHPHAFEGYCLFALAIGATLDRWLVIKTTLLRSAKTYQDENRLSEFAPP